MIWNYKTEYFDIERNGKITLDDKLNEFGKSGWDIFFIEETPNFDIKIGKYKIGTSTTYRVIMKRKIK